MIKTKSAAPTKPTKAAKTPAKVAAKVAEKDPWNAQVTFLIDPSDAFPPPHKGQHTGQLVGYVRVSSIDQNTDRQLEGVALDRTYTDKASGKDTQRPQLQAALSYVRAGDTLVVHSMDRLARNLDDLRAVVKDLTGRGVAVRFIKESLTFTGEDSPMSNLLLSVMGAFAEFERSLIRERQREGVAIAKAAGKYKGRALVLNEREQQTLRARASAGENKAALAREFNISRSALYAYLDRS